MSMFNQPMTDAKGKTWHFKNLTIITNVEDTNKKQCAMLKSALIDINLHSPILNALSLS